MLAATPSGKPRGWNSASEQQGLDARRAEGSRGHVPAGVDSSVVAALLVEQGHEVIGATLQLYDHGARHPEEGCPAAPGRTSTMRRPRWPTRLGIPHYVLDPRSPLQGTP
jgi:hypothetical protein